MYDYETNDVFNEDYFDIDEMQSANEAVTIIELCLVNMIPLIKVIVRAIQSAARKKSIIVDYDKMVKNGIRENDAKKYVNETIKFLNDKGYASIDKSAKVVRFSDLTPEGQKFMTGYYDSIGKIDDFTVKKAIDSNKTKLQKILSGGGNTIDAVTSCVIAIFNIALTVVSGIEALPPMLALCLFSYIDVVNIANKFINRLKYEKNKPAKENYDERNDELNDALESAYDSGYEKAMHDMEIYNDIAMEGPARDYRHKQNEGKSREDIRYDRFDRKRGTTPSKYRRRHFGSDDNNRAQRERDLYLKYNPGTHYDVYSSRLHAAHRAMSRAHRNRYKYDESMRDLKFRLNYVNDPAAKNALRDKYEKLYDNKYSPRIANASIDRNDTFNHKAAVYDKLIEMRKRRYANDKAKLENEE